MLKSDIRALEKEIHPELVAIRRQLHAHPELSFQEHQTAALICKWLDQLKIPYQKGLAGTGVVGFIKGKNPGKSLRAFRADMDALPIQEAGEKPYRSTVPGVMHACGHDVHTTCLLGLAHILQTLKNRWEGTIQLIFQPGEELLPGGASLLLDEGIFSPLKPEAIIAQHVHPPLEAGKVGFRAGPYMASSDELYLTVTGKGGHGAMPHDCIDPIAIMAQIISGLQMVVSRYANPFTPSVLTFGRIQSDGGATNIIPNSVSLQGTFRTMDESWRIQAHQQISSIVSGIAQSFGAEAVLRIVQGYPVLVNDPKLTARCREASESYLGTSNVVDLPMRMTSEDFAWYSHHIPACFFRLGTGNVEKGISSPIHTDTFDIDESALSIGAGLMAWLAVAE
jgi:amidohydrolase